MSAFERAGAPYQLLSRLTQMYSKRFIVAQQSDGVGKRVGIFGWDQQSTVSVANNFRNAVDPCSYARNADGHGLNERER
jgi:hypothetical protein